VKKLIKYYLMVIILVFSLATVTIANGMQTDPKGYVYFVLNISDFRHVDLSAAYIGRIIDLFSRYNLGVDLYFTEPVLKAFQRDHPQLLTKIKAYPRATINYHIRPPHPCDHAMLRLPDHGDHCRPLSDLDTAFVQKELNNFESYELVVHDYDFRSRNYCPHYNAARIGGFDYVRQVFGTTPIFIGRVGDDLAQRMWAAVLKGKGAKGIVAPQKFGGGGNQPFRIVHGLLSRPADFDCIFPEIAGGRNPYEIFRSKLRHSPPLSRPIFGNVLVHDYDFYHRGIWMDDETPTRKFGDWRKSGQEQAHFWRAYEQLVEALARDQEIRVVNAKELIALGERFQQK
jgi:hypothetical protein